MDAASRAALLSEPAVAELLDGREIDAATTTTA
jgi:hypothetical protein